MPHRKSPPQIITLLSDFGLRDSFVAEMKGRLLSLCPDAVLVDISHEIEPGDIAAGAFVLGHAYRAFPPGTIHVAVVDPGVGGKRKPLILSAQRHYFIGPDNGLFTQPASGGPSYRAFEILPCGQSPAPTFHGRDLFAPAAAALACGRAPSRLGRRLEKIKLLEHWRPVPLARDRGWQGRIVVCDRFGNLLTNLPGNLLAAMSKPVLRVGRCVIGRWVRTYCEAAPGHLCALVNSQGLIEIFLREDSARNKTRWPKDTTVELLPTFHK
jgi:S-adenosyl-L-methionine hydrolase (adenosine-forming)